jgi:acetyl-CoA synthetase
MAVTITLRPGAMVGWKRIVVTVGAPDKENTELESVRRLISFRAIFENRDPGDLSALANPEAIDHIRQKLAAG